MDAIIKARRRLSLRQVFRLFGILVPLLAIGIPLIKPLQAHATSTAGFNAGDIISNVVFTDAGTMNVAQIQGFLDSKVTTCDTQGSLSYTFSGVTKTGAQWAQYWYGPSSSNPNAAWASPPFTCLKDYTQNGLSAAQIIYNAAQQYQINPQVLIVLLQKEQGLVTDTWPTGNEYQSATGYGCPDSSVCSSEYYGFTNQIDNAANMFHSIMTQNPNWYSPYTLGNNTIQWNPNTSCGSSTVNIQNLATAALYDYTPYQPNAAALAAGYGTGDSCSSYGNRNFYLYFNDWFGSTNDPSLYVAVIKTADSSALYMQTPNGKYYILNGTVLNDWGLNAYAVQTVSDQYMSSLNTGPNLGNLLEDNWGNMFLIENGQLHYISNGSYMSLWNLNPNQAVQSQGIVYSLPSVSWAGRFAQDSSQPSGQIWLIDNGTKRAVPDTNTLYEWGYTPNQLTSVSSTYLASLPTGNNVVQYATDGTTDYLVDTDRKLTFSSSNVENAFEGSASPSTYSPTTLSFLPTSSTNQFVEDSSTGMWYMLEGGNKHYITNGSIASVWGESANQSPTIMSPGFMASIPDQGSLQYVVQTSNPSLYWVVDGTKRYIATGAIATAWLGTATPPLYSTQSLDLLTTGAPINSTINTSSSPYMYLMDGGIKRYLSTPSAVSGWAAPTSTVSSALQSIIPEGSFITNVIQDTSGDGYVLLNGTAYPIDPSYKDAWGISSSTPSVSLQTIARYTVGSTLQASIIVNGVPYVISNGQQVPIKTYADAYPSALLNGVTLPANPLTVAAQASYLIKSTDPTDSSVWLMVNGQKQLLSSFNQQVTYGYLSNGIQPTPLSPSVLAIISTDSQPFTQLIQNGASGIKFVDFGYALGFPDGTTLTNYVGSSGILQVSPSVYNAFKLTRSISRLIVDDYGNYYWISNGQKQAITSGAVLARYNGTPVTYLEGTTIALIPNGPPLT